MGIWYAATRIIFKVLDKHPYVAYQGQEIKVPLSEELKGLDLISLTDRNGWLVKVNEDATRLVLTNEVDGGEV